MALYEVYKRQYFTYMEINPLVVTDTAIYILDFAAKVGWFFLFKVPWHINPFLIYFSWIQPRTISSKRKELI